MNGGSTDFSSWQANGRGVDLNHNYNCGFAEYKKLEYEMNIIDGAPSKYSGESPESESEVGYLCNYLRFNDNIGAVITLHSQGEEIYYSSMGKTTLRSLPLAKSFSRMSGYALSVPEGSAAYGGMLDWCIHELGIPAFTFECGKGKNPLPIDNMFKIYTDLREVLFSAPCMI
jgi:g-D-glutamyl-meso-diaminopimelate peptidase